MSKRDRRPERHGGSAKPQSDRVRLFGIHAVAAALANPNRDIIRLRLTDNAEHRLEAALRVRGAKVERVHPRDLDKVLGAETVHQGAVLETSALPDVNLETAAAAATTGGPLIVLDQVTDPHNVGAIIRSAAVFGAAGLVLTRRNAPELSGALAKAASGALEHVPVTLVTNLARAMEELAVHGLQRIGLDGDADGLIEDADLAGPLALILGSEGRGLRRLTREGCDRLCRIGATGAIASLNVSNAAAVAMHTVSFRRRQKPRF
jgi:23S rRNA (guanosine2251-2'-O)-methyltransferase